MFSIMGPPPAWISILSWLLMDGFLYPRESR
jgi:hypothetical protein